ERFLETIEGGLARLDEIRSQAVISGEEAFKLHDTYGFPLDLTQVIAGERGQTVDVAGFERALEEQRRRSRAARPVHTSRRVAGGPGGWVEGKPKKKTKGGRPERNEGA